MILAGDFIPKNLKVHLPDEFKGQLVLANLEGPICAGGLPQSNKVGVCLHTSRELFDCSDCSIVRLEGGGEAPRFAFSLANNHTMDFREEGLRQTKEVLDAQGIPYAGAGANEEEARKPMILEENGKRIAVFCCCERQFGMATRTTTGCADKGPWLYAAIQNVKSSRQADYVIVSCHAASEYSPWVSPTLHDFYHSLIDAGADCIHGHHAHVPQVFEEYKGKPIFYGLGNFVMEKAEAGNNPHQLWSVMAEVEFGEKIKWQVKFIDLEYGEAEIRPVISTGAKHKAHVTYMKLANLQFAESGRNLVGCWQETAIRMYRRLYSQPLRAFPVERRCLSIHDRLRKLGFTVFDVISAVLGVERASARSLRYGKVLFNYFNCESHQVAIAEALGVLTGVIPDRRTPEIVQTADDLKIGAC